MVRFWALGEWSGHRLIVHTRRASVRILRIWRMGVTSTAKSSDARPLANVEQTPQGKLREGGLFRNKFV